MSRWLYRCRDYSIGALIWVLCVLIGAGLLLWDTITRRKPEPPGIGND